MDHCTVPKYSSAVSHTAVRNAILNILHGWSVNCFFSTDIILEQHGENDRIAITWLKLEFDSDLDRQPESTC